MNFFVIFLVTTNEVFGAENLASIDKEIEEKLLSRCKYKPNKTTQFSQIRIPDNLCCFSPDKIKPWNLINMWNCFTVLYDIDASLRFTNTRCNG